ncbi:hypothetical protein LSTR_LSTR001324 [Laodelphax striatellus]|uniref:JmjC domain-containing histone demethylation protein 2C n=1 Tax=Laodelphax striatellus TaxID=195883 RepID=A0A482XFB4_LAOST|nr:hypothetical protein LSTR_LSTR001324 [Laodelphax striatellus]
MAHKYRDEVVGKRFLSVSASSKLKLSKISEWGWKAGVIRAATHKDNTNKDLQVLVEYDGLEWQKREWVSVYREDMFKVFMVESGLYWARRPNPHGSGTLLWPALKFTTLVARVDLKGLQPLEFLHDQYLLFSSDSQLQPYKEWDPGLAGGLRGQAAAEVREAARVWCEAQDGQRILLTTPSVLVGYRVQVYRSEGTTQFYTAVIVGYNETNRELTVTDDTVLEEHNEDPCLLQMRLIGDGVVESIMRGEEVGITPRRSRSSVAATPNHFPPTARRRGGESGHQHHQHQLQSQGEVRKLRRNHIVQTTPSSNNNKGKKSSEVKFLMCC